MPVFVKIEEYKEILEVLDLLNKRLVRSREIISRIREVKDQEDAELEMWVKDLDEVENRIAFMNKTMGEPNL
jgi:tetrahydromethanopterin S-methyltransferase subunit G